MTDSIDPDSSSDASSRHPKEGPLHRPTKRASKHPRIVSFSAAAVYETIRVEGVHEMQRPPSSLWWSGLAAGLCMVFSVLTPVFLQGAPTGVSPLGYTVGFLLVVLGRMQLFTENTLTTVLPLLSTPTLRAFGLTARLWAVVFAANVLGGGLAAVGVWNSGILEGHFGHVIAGSIELQFSLLAGDTTWTHGLFGFLLPVFLGNVVGGTGLFALLSYGQVAHELPQPQEDALQ